MQRNTALAMLSCLCVSALGCGPALAQPDQSAGSACRPATQAVRTLNAGSTEGPPPAPRPPAGPRDLTIVAIPGVVAGGGAWTRIWQQGGNSADGILAGKDGMPLFAQEDYDAALRITPDGKVSVAVANSGGLSSLSMDRQGRLYGVHRTERVESTKPNKAAIVNAVSILAPQRSVLTDKWADGSPLTVRPNDLAADSHGGAFFTGGCVYYAGPKGVVVVADNLRTNGIVFSPDDKVLYVTNGPGVVAFDVTGVGQLSNRRDFAALPPGANGDGLAVDTEGRLYVSSGPGVQVFDKTGKHLGVIPTPRGIISIAFAGPDKRTLYAVGGGADDAGGQPIREGPQKTAASIFRLAVLSQGLKDRAK